MRLKIVNARGQTWSFDLIIAVVLFIIAVGLFYSFLSSERFDDNTRELENGAAIISTRLNCDVTASEVCILSKRQIDQAKLDVVVSESYDAVKTELGVNGEFCIYLRDASGALIPLDTSGTSSYGDDTLLLFDDGTTKINCGDMLP